MSHSLWWETSAAVCTKLFSWGIHWWEEEGGTIRETFSKTKTEWDWTSDACAPSHLSLLFPPLCLYHSPSPPCPFFYPFFPCHVFFKMCFQLYLLSSFLSLVITFVTYSLFSLAFSQPDFLFIETVTGSIMEFILMTVKQCESCIGAK